MSKKSPNSEGLLYMSLNQDQSCIVVGTEKGFKVYDTIPFKLRYQRSKQNNIKYYLYLQFWEAVLELLK